MSAREITEPSPGTFTVKITDAGALVSTLQSIKDAADINTVVVDISALAGQSIEIAQDIDFGNISVTLSNNGEAPVIFTGGGVLTFSGTVQIDGVVLPGLRLTSTGVYSDASTATFSGHGIVRVVAEPQSINNGEVRVLTESQEWTAEGSQMGSVGSAGGVDGGGLYGLSLHKPINASSADTPDIVLRHLAYLEVDGSRRSVSSSDASAVAQGGFAYGNVSMTNNGDVTITGNAATATAATSAVAQGGAVYGALDITSGDSDPENGDTVMIAKNVAQGKTAAGGVLCAEEDKALTLTGGKIVLLAQNQALGTESAEGGVVAGGASIQASGIRHLEFNGNFAQSSGSALGGVLCGGNLGIADTSQVLFAGNAVAGTTARGSVLYNAGLSIENVGTTQFRSNYEYENDTLILRSVYAQDGLAPGMTFHLQSGQTVLMYDSVYYGTTATGASLTLDGAGVLAFSAFHVASDLADLRNGTAASAEEITASSTSYVAGTLINGGTLMVGDGAIYTGTNMTVSANGSLALYATQSSITLSGCFVQEGSVVIDFSGMAAGEYRLLNYTSYTIGDGASIQSQNVADGLNCSITYTDTGIVATLTGEVLPHPDICVVAASAEYIGATSSGVVTVQITLQNYGNCATSEDSALNIYFSANGKLDDDSILASTAKLGSALASLSQNTYKLGIDITSLNLPLGNYSIIVEAVDPNEQASTLQDNTAAIGTLRHAPNVRVAAAETPYNELTTEDTLSVSFNLQNLGTTVTESQTTVYLYLTQNGVVDGNAISLGAVSVNTPAAGMQTQYTLDAKLSAADNLKAGAYTIVAAVSNPDEPTASTGDNASGIGTVTVQTFDLAVVAGDTFYSANKRESLEVTFRLDNTGGAELAEETEYCIYLVKDEEVGDGLPLIPAPILVQQGFVTTPNAHQAKDCTVTIDFSQMPDLAEGYYQIVVDVANAKESGKNLSNNSVGVGRLELHRHMTVFVVNSLADRGEGTLRDAVTRANACAEDEDVVIKFDPSLAGQKISCPDELTLSHAVALINIGDSRVSISTPGLIINADVQMWDIALEGRVSWQASDKSHHVLIEQCSFSNMVDLMNMGSQAGTATVEIYNSEFSYLGVRGICDLSGSANTFDELYIQRNHSVTQEEVDAIADFFAASTINGTNSNAELSELEGEVRLPVLNNSAWIVSSIAENAHITSAGSLELHGDVHLPHGAEFTCEPGSVVDGNLVAQDGAGLILDGARMMGNVTMEPGSTLRCMDAQFDARLEVAAGATMTGSATIASGGTLVMEGTVCEGTLTMVAGANAEVHNCDLSKVGISVFASSEDYTIDLSGNWWGTTDEAEIRAKIAGSYDPARVILDGWLTENPSECFEVDDIVGAKNLSAATRSLTVRFTWAVDASSVTGESVYLENAQGQLVPVLSTTVKGKEITLTFDTLPTDGDYRLVIGPGVMSTSGVTLQKQLDELGQADYRIPLYADVTGECITDLRWESAEYPPYLDVVLSNAIDPSTVSVDGIQLLDPQGAAVSIARLEMKGDAVIRLYVDAPMGPGDYELTLPATITDSAGNPLAEGGRTGSARLKPTTVLVVTSLADDYGAGTLRYACDYANYCGGEENVIITFAEDLYGPIYLEYGIYLDHEVTINNNSSGGIYLACKDGYGDVLSTSSGLTLNNMHVNGAIALSGDATLEGAGNDLSQIRLSDFSGSISDVLRLQPDSSLSIEINSLSGDAVLSKLSGDGSSYTLYCSVSSGQTLTVEEGVTVQGDVTVKSGGTMRLNGAQIQGSISLYPGATLEGAENVFTSDCPIYLEDWSGTASSALGAFNSLENSSFESANLQIGVASLSGDAVLDILPEGFSSYNALRLYVDAGQTLTVEEGVTLKGTVYVKSGGTMRLNDARVEASLYLYPGAMLEGAGNVFASARPIYLREWSGNASDALVMLDSLENTTFESENMQIGVYTISGDTVLDALPEGFSSYYASWLSVGKGKTLTVEEGVTLNGVYAVNSGGTLRLNGVRVEGFLYLSPGATLEGEGNIFTSDRQICLSNWNGRASDALSMLDSLENTTFESENVKIDISTISGEAILDTLPEGFSYYVTGLYVSDGNTLTVNEGVSLAGDIYIESGGTLNMKDATCEGSLSIRDGANAVIDTCDLGTTGLSIYTKSNTQIHNCDLSRTNLVICDDYYMGGGGSGDVTVIDLSGNWWGTTDEAEIRAKINGYYDPSYTHVIIDGWLTESPLAKFAVEDIVGSKLLSAADRSLTVCFSQAVDAASVTAETVYLEDAQGQRIPLLSTSVEGKEVTLTFDTLPADGDYRLVIGPGVMSTGGVTLQKQLDELGQADYRLAFRADVTAERVTALQWEASAQPSYLDVRLGGAIDPSTVSATSGIQLLNPQGAAVSIQRVEMMGDTVIRLYVGELKEPGDYELSLPATITDNAGNALAEDSRTGSTTLASSSLSIAAGSAAYDAQVNSDATFPISITNSGNVAEEEVKVKIWLKDAAGNRVLLGATTAEALAAGETRVLECSLPLDESLNLEEAGYTLVAEVSGSHELPALRSNNESAIGTLNVTYPPAADLRITAMSMPETLKAGQSVDFQVTVTNEGTAPARGPLKMTLYLIPTGGTLSQGVQLGTYQVTDASISISQGVTFSFTPEGVQIPADIALAGDVQVAAVINPDGEIYEKPADRADNVYIAPEVLALPNTLTLSVSATEVKEGDSRRVVYTITRSGDTSSALTVQLSCEQAELLGLPPTLTIAAGQSYTRYQKAIVNNSVYQGDQTVDIAVSAEGYTPCSARLTVLDDELPALTLTLPETSLAEGESMTATLMLGVPAREDMVVKLGSSLSGQLTMPTSVIIKAGETSANFQITAINDMTAEIDKTLTITAKADGATTAKAELKVVDDDIPAVQLVLNRALISEGDGYAVITATLIRTGNMSEAVTVRLADTNNIGLILPSSIRIGANVKAVNFNIGVVDDTIVNGERTGVITGTLILESCGCSATTSTNGGEIVSVPVTVTDNDGPTLSVKLSRTTLREGGSETSTLTVTTNYVTDQDLVVQLSDSSGYLNLPETVVIPAGQNSATVSITAKTDSQTSGSHLSTITAAAEGFTAGTGFIQVTDIDLPDLVVRSVTVDGEAVAGCPLTVSIEVFNQGYAATNKPVVVSLVLQDGTELGTVTLNGTVAAGESVTLAKEVTLPLVTGQSYIKALVNSDNSVVELDLTNNTTTSASFNIGAGYEVEVQTDQSVVYTGSPVTITGRLIPTLDGQSVAGQHLKVQVRTARGLMADISVETDAEGHFSTTYTPAEAVVGTYSVSAVVLGENTGTLATFENAGVSVDVNTYFQWDVEIGEPISGSFTITNTGNVALTNLHVVSDDIPSNISMQLEGMDEVLEVGESLTVNYTVSGLVPTNADQYQKFAVSILSDEGYTKKINAYAYVTNLLGDVALSTAKVKENIYFDSTSGTSSVRYVEFTITNKGNGETGLISINLPSVDWMYLYSQQTIGSLGFGESATVTLAVDASRVQDLVLNYAYEGALVVNSENGGSERLDFSFTFVEEKTASLRVELHDSYTQYADSKSVVSTARLRLENAYNRTLVYSTHADENGVCTFSEVPAGTYYLIVDADGCAQSKTVVKLGAGADVQEVIQLSNQAVSYVWNVEKMEYEEVYNIAQTVDFVTKVPAPDLRMTEQITIPELTWGESTVVTLTVSNYGLIAAKDFSLTLPEWDNYTFNVLNPVDSIAANSSHTYYIEVTWGNPDSPIEWTGSISPPPSAPPTEAADVLAALQKRVTAILGTSENECETAVLSIRAYLNAIGVPDEQITSETISNFIMAKVLGTFTPVSALAISTDLGVQTPGLSLSFIRSYTSNALEQISNTGLGKGWSSNWDVALSWSDDGVIMIHDGNRSCIFMQNDQGGFTAVGQALEMTRDANGGYAVKYTEGFTRHFSATTGLLTSVEDSLGNSIVCEYDANNNLVKLTHSNGEFIRFTWDGDHITSATNSNGLSVRYSYTDGDLTSVTDSRGGTSTYEYENGLMTRAVDAAGSASRFSYDSFGNLSGVSSEHGESSISYGRYGDVTMTDVGGNSSTYYYDEKGRLRVSVDAGGNAMAYGYDSLGRMTWCKDQTGAVIRYEYDAAGDLVKTTDAKGNSVTYTYNEQHLITSVMDANGKVERFVYDGRGNMIGITHADGSTETWCYDDMGKLTQYTGRDDVQTNYVFNDSGNLVSYTIGSADAVVYSYDSNGLLNTVTGVEGTTTFTYDDRFRLIRMTDANGTGLTYTYDELDRVASICDVDGQKTLYTYDSLNRIDSVQDGEGNLYVHYEYDQCGRVVRVENGNGTTTEYEYTAIGKTASLVNYAADGSVLSSYRYSYGATGLCDSVVTSDGTWTYKHDLTGQLTEAYFEPAEGSEADAYSAIYEYDAVGNRTRTVINGNETLYTNGVMDQVTSVGDTVMEYDSNGNLIRKTDGNGVVTTYTYNSHGKLTGVTGSDGTVEEYAYNSLGQRISATCNGVVTNYRYDFSGNIIAEYDADGNKLNSYIYGNNLVGYVTATGLDYYYTSDSLGSVTGITNATGQMDAGYLYDPFGNLLNPGAVAADKPLFLWLGTKGLQTNADGLVNLNARTYDPATGVFIQSDPSVFGDSTNMYAYCTNQPLVIYDSTGMSSRRIQVQAYGIKQKTEAATSAANKGDFENFLRYDDLGQYDGPGGFAGAANLVFTPLGYFASPIDKFMSGSLIAISLSQAYQNPVNRTVATTIDAIRDAMHYKRYLLKIDKRLSVFPVVSKYCSRYESMRDLMNLSVGLVKGYYPPASELGTNAKLGMWVGDKVAWVVYNAEKGTLGQKVNDAVLWVGNGVLNTVEKAWNNVKDIGGAIADKVDNVIGDVEDSVEEAIGNVSEAVDKIGTTVVDAIKRYWPCHSDSIKIRWVECDNDGTYRWKTSTIKTDGDCTDQPPAKPSTGGVIWDGGVGLGGPFRDGDIIFVPVDPNNPGQVVRAKGECTPCKAGIINSILRCTGLDSATWFDTFKTFASFLISPVNAAKELILNIASNIFSIKCAKSVLDTLDACDVLSPQLRKPLDELLDVMHGIASFAKILATLWNIKDNVKDLVQIKKDGIVKTANKVMEEYLDAIGVNAGNISLGKGPLSITLCLKATYDRVAGIVEDIRSLLNIKSGNGTSGTAASAFLTNSLELSAEDIMSRLAASMGLAEVSGPFDMSLFLLDGTVDINDYIEWNNLLVESIAGADKQPRALTDSQIAALQSTKFSTLYGLEPMLNLYYNAWNTTLRYNELGIYSVEDLERVNAGDKSGIPTDLLDPETGNLSDWFFSTEYYAQLQGTYDYADNLLSKSGYTKMEDYVGAARENLTNYVTEDESGVCATVTLQFSQSVTMSREAFEGSLTLNNSGSDMSDVSFVVHVVDSNGVDMTDHFEVNYYYVSDEFGNYSGGGRDSVSGATLAANTSGSMSIRFTPGREVAKTEAEAYDFTATLSYKDAEGMDITMDLTPVTLAVNPSPSLTLHYFLQEDIYSDNPFTDDVEAVRNAQLGVLVQNNGFGTAKNYRMSDFTVDYLANDMGLALDFNFVGVSLNGGEMKSLGTDVLFGDIAGNSTASAIWYFTTNLQGTFQDYKTSTITRTDSLGNVSVVTQGDEFSLIDDVKDHMLVRSLDADGDGKTDFLANDDEDALKLGDALYLGDGTQESVNGVITYSTTETLGNGMKTITITVHVQAGYNHIKLLDPGEGAYVIDGVSVSGSDLAAGCFWQTDRDFSGDGSSRSVARLHMLYRAESEADVSFTLTYDSVDHSAPMVEGISGVENRSSVSEVPEVEVTFSEAINQSTFTAECIELQKNGVKVDPSAITWEWTSDRTLRLTNLNALAAGDSLYTLTVTNKGLQDVFGNAGIGDGKQLQWTMAAESLSIRAMKLMEARQGKDPVATVQISFTTAISDFNRSHLYVRCLKDGVITYVEDLSGVSIRQSDESGCVYEVTGLDTLQGTDGDYLIGVNTENLYAANGTQAVATAADLGWTLCRTAPTLLDTKSDVAPNTFEQARKVLFTFDHEIAQVDSESLHLLCNGVETTAYTLAAEVDAEDATKVVVTLLDASGQEQRRGLRGAGEDELALQGEWSLQMDLGGVTDIYGNVGNGSTTATWELDSVAPNAVQDITLNGKENTAVPDATVTLGMTLPEGNLKVTVYAALMTTPSLGTKLWSGTVGNTDFSETLTLPYDGIQKLNIVLEDAAGNTTTCAFQVMVDAFALGADIKAEEKYTQAPESIPLVFSAPVNGLTTAALSLTCNGAAVDTAGLTLTQVSDTEWALSGLDSAMSENGAYTVSVDLSQLTKASSGLSGKGAVSAAFTVDSITSVEVIDSNVVSTPGSVESLSVSFSTAINYAELSISGLLSQAVRLINQETGEVVLLDAAGFSYADNEITWSGCVAVPAGQYAVVVDAALVTASNGAPLTLGGNAETALSGFAASASPLGAMGVSYSAPYAVDWNGDALVDLLVGEKTGSEGKLRVYLNQGTATSPIYTNYTYLQADGADLSVVASGCQGLVVTLQDLNGDGTADLIAGLSDGKVVYYLADGAGSFGAQQQLAALPGSRAFPTFFDWNSDGTADLVIGAGDGSIYYAAATVAEDGSSVFGAPQVINGIKVSGRAAPVFADVNGDGMADVIVGDANGNLSLYYAANGAYSLVKTWTLDGVDWERTRPTMADLNNDGKTDIIVGGSTGNVYVLYGQENAWSSAPVTVEPLPQLSAVQLAAQGSKLSVTWNVADVPQGAIYKVQISAAGDFSDAVEYTGDASGTLSVEDVADGTYTARVRIVMPNGVAGEWQSSASTLVDTTAPAIPADLTAQADGSAIAFAWGGVQDPSGVRYEIRYSQKEDFSQANVREVTGNAFDISGLADGTWYWQVRAVDGKGNVSDWVSGESLAVNTAVVSHWAEGVTENAGYYDVNKSGTAADNNLCWAAASSNILAWWQQAYDTAGTTHIEVTRSAQGIYATMQQNWKNVSGREFNGFVWWLDSAACTDETYLSYAGTNLIGSDGSYYFAYFNGENLATQVVENTLKGVGKSEVAATWSDLFAGGVGMTLGVYKNTTVSGTLLDGHAVSLWGFDCSQANNTLTRIYVTDSDDGVDALVSLDVLYDTTTGLYKVDDSGSKLDGYYLGNYTYLANPAQDLFASVPAAPTGLNIMTPSKKIDFDWNAVSGAATYTLQYALDGDYANAVTLSGLTHDIHELALKVGEVAEGTYMWRVRAVGSNGELSAWAEGSSFLVDLSVEQVSGVKASVSSNALGTTVTLTWNSVTDISGISHYNVQYSTNADFSNAKSSTASTFFMKDGYNYYCHVNAQDGRNNIGAWSDTVVIINSGTAQAGESGVLLSWLAVENASGYAVRYATDADFAEYETVMAEDASLNLTGLLSGTDYYWRVVALDGDKLMGDWSYADTFTTRVNVYNDTPVGTQSVLVLQEDDTKSVISAKVDEYVGATDPEDYFRVRVDQTSTYDLSLDLNALSNPVYLSVGTLSDSAFQVISTVLVSASGGGTKALRNILLQGGTDYYVRVSAADGTGSGYNGAYTLTMQTEKVADNRITANNTPETATRLALQSDDTAGFGGWIGVGDEVDTYRIELEEDGALRVNLQNLDYQAKLQVYQVENGETSGFLNRTVRTNGLDKELSVSAGIYYVQVSTVGTGSSSYNTAYSLDIETEINGTRKQGVLAAV